MASTSAVGSGSVKKSPPLFHFILWETRPQAFGERAPEAVQPAVNHLKPPPEIARFPPIKKQIGLRGIGVQAPVAHKHAQGDQGVKEIPALRECSPKPSCKA